MNTDDLREEYGERVTQYNWKIDDDLWTDDYVLWLEKQLLIQRVVVPKGTLCDCKKHSIKTSYGFEICTKCGNEWDE